MASKSATTRERIGRIGQRRQVVIPRDILETLHIQEGDLVAFTRKAGGVLIKPKRLVDPDDVLTPEEGVRLKRAEREMRQGKYISLTELNHELARPRSSRSRKTA